MTVLLLVATTLALLSALPGQCECQEDEPVVTTPLGKVRGYTMTSRGGRKFFAFSGLPYAQPPVGHLRFEAPRPLTPWNGTRDATEDGPYCLQANTYELTPVVRGVEDCLYLTLYTHNVSKRAPVMVHFHGGGYVSANGARRTKPDYLMDEDVVVVDVNYRVGILGFLSFEEKEMPGNQGMKDQSQSLRWVRDNIASFGGDPGCVTILGESAGAQSVYHHTVSPLSRGLFHRAISESGTGYNLGSLMPRGYARKQTLRLAELTNCTRNSTSAMVACFKSLSAGVIASQLVKYRQWQIDPVATFRVVFEEGVGAFLTWPISSWEHAPVPYLMGTTSAEGLLRTMYFVYYNMSWEWYTEHFNEIAPISLGYFASSSDPPGVTKKVREYYLPKRDISLDDWPAVVQMYSDSWFTMGIIQGANNHPGNVFFYYFDYLGEHTFGGNRNRSLIIGAFHTDELFYIWKMERYANLTGQDLVLSKKLVKLWTNFAKFGTPTPKGNDFTWSTWKPNRHQYLNISNDGFSMDEGFAEDRYQFWSRLKYRDNLDK